MKARLVLALMLVALLPGLVHGFVLFPGDGSDEPGFVAPQAGAPPPPPPAQIASAESVIPYPCPPAVPVARSEKKRPPTPPIMFTKIKSDRGLLDWETRPNDLNNLLKSMKQMINVDFSMEVKSFGEINGDPEKNPILYRTGHFHFELSPAERLKLRDYLLKGGMIIFNTGMGSKPFYDSAKRELAAIFPEVPVQRLSADHPIFHSYYDLAQVKYRKGVRDTGYLGSDPWFEGVTIDCRTVAVISRWGMAIGWDALDDDKLQGYSIESAQKLGVNLLSYATAQRAWAKNLVHAMEFTDPDPSMVGKMTVAQVIYDGEWKTRHAGVSVLLQQFNQLTGVPVKFARKELRLSDKAIFDVPILYMTGHEDFRLNAAEVAGLRQYLQNGGLLFAEACCGRRGFDAGLRRELQKALPGQSLVRIASSDQLFNSPNQINALGVTPALAAQLGNKSGTAPHLMSIPMDGHHAVIYSPFGLAGGWELSPNPYALGYDTPGSLSLGENILFYGITQ
ncbi:DUF4159 domain-containing protein [bacterium]|nr:DUF4159 domain-containing protein [bacterium]